MTSHILLLFIYAVGIASVAMMWSLVGDGFFPHAYAWPFTAIFLLIMLVSTIAWHRDNHPKRHRK